jgi:hypothetical protein
MTTFMASSLSGYFGKRLCVPSQKGLRRECLQPQSQTVSGVLRGGMLNGIGSWPVPAWEPSHHGWFFERPQAHQR